MQDAESTVGILGKLKAMGVQLAIDDFGTVYSSFTYLRRFPVDALKLDQSFVQEITEDPGDATIVSAMINICKSLKRRIIAEGVETRAQLKFLQRHGCGEGQGYYFSHPVVAEQAGKLLRTGIREEVVQLAMIFAPALRFTHRFFISSLQVANKQTAPNYHGCTENCAPRAIHIPRDFVWVHRLHTRGTLPASQFSGLTSIEVQSGGAGSLTFMRPGPC